MIPLMKKGNFEGEDGRGVEGVRRKYGRGPERVRRKLWGLT